MYALETIEQDGYAVTLYQDLDPESPDDWDNLGVLYHSSGFTFGEPMGEPTRGWDVWARALALYGDDVAAVVPVRVETRGGQQTIYEASSGNANGAIATTHKRLSELCGDDPTYHARAWAEDELRGEIEVWRQYLEGEVYGYVVQRPDGEDSDSLWGLYGWEYALDEARVALEVELDSAEKRRAQIARGWALAHGAA